MEKPKLKENDYDFLIANGSKHVDCITYPDGTKGFLNKPVILI